MNRLATCKNLHLTNFRARHAANKRADGDNLRRNPRDVSADLTDSRSRIRRIVHSLPLSPVLFPFLRR